MDKEVLKNIIVETKKLVLLYVEDDERIAIQTMNILKKFFDNIIYAKDGEEGVNKFNESHIDLIISDINMPNLNGLEMLQQIKSINPSTPLNFNDCSQ